MKLLVTGGAGFIGSAVIRHIIQNTNDAVVNLDKLTYAGNLESLTEVSDSERYAFEQVDICNRPEVDRVLAQHQPKLEVQKFLERFTGAPCQELQDNWLTVVSTI